MIRTMEEIDMDKDPICGMTVDEVSALHAERVGFLVYDQMRPCPVGLPA